MNETKTRRNFYLPDSLYRSMWRAAKKKGVSVGAWLREAIAHYLKAGK